MRRFITRRAGSASGPGPATTMASRMWSARPVTTPFDMVMRNDLDRFHLVMDVIDRVSSLGSHAAELRQAMGDRRDEARAYARANGEDPPEISDWTWPR